MTENALIVNEGQLPSTEVNYGQDAMQGNEDFKASDFNMPYLVLLQKMSPQVDEDTDQHIKGARPGDFMNTMTSRIYDGKKGVYLIPCAKSEHCNEMREEGKKKVFIRSHSVDSEVVQSAEWKDNRKKLDNGNIISDVTNYFCLLVNPETPDQCERVIVSFKFMSLKDCKNLNTIIRETMGKYKSPMFAVVVKTTSGQRSKNDDPFKGWDFEGPVAMLDPSHPLYTKAKEFRDFAKMFTEEIRESSSEPESSEHAVTETSDLI